jgi:hypothetical protein
MKTNTLWILIAATAVSGACAKGEQTSQTADSTARNLTLAPTESSAAMRDVPAPAAPAPAPTPAPAPAPKPVPVRPPEPPRPVAPPPPTTFSLAAGTEVDLTVEDTITTRSAKAGDAFSATVGESVRDPSGHVVIPAGSTASGLILHADPAPNGRLELSINSITVRGQSYPIAATVVGKDTVMKGRGVTGSEAAKVGGGTAIGALAGHLLGKSTASTLIGGAAGAAAGVAVAEKTKKTDVVLPAGAAVRVQLSQALTVSAH